MNWRERAQHIFARVQDNGKSSIRRIAAATGIAKSAVHRHLQALERRNQRPESLLGNPTGQQWCAKLVLATVYGVGFKKQGGQQKRSQHSSICCIWVAGGVSPTALRSLEADGEQILHTKSSGRNTRAGSDSD